MLIFQNLTISYGKNKVLENINFAAPEGITCIIGHSGSGKSSLLNACMNLIPYQCDNYFLYNFELNKIGKEKKNQIIRSKYTYFTQGNNFINDLSCYDNLKFYANLAGKEVNNEDIEKCVKQVGLTINEKTMPSNLSGGERQRLSFAQALLKDTDVILCDEMTASLDPQVKKEILYLLKEIAIQHHKIIILTTHDEDVFDYCDCIYEIENKSLKLIKGTLIPSEKEKKVLVHKKRLSSKLIKNYVASKAERQYGMFMLYCLISALVVALSSFLVYFSWDYVTSQNNFLGNQINSELYVINQSTPLADDSINRYIYTEINAPFSDEIYEKLLSIEHVKSVYPYFTGAGVSNPGTGYTKPEEKIVSLLFEDGNKNEITIEMDDISHNVLPYYEEQHFEDKFEIINEKYLDFGCYIHISFAEQLGFTLDNLDSLKNCSIKMEISLPVASTIYAGRVTIGNGEPIDTDFYYKVLQLVEIEIPIIGVVPYSYTELTGNRNIYLPYQYLEQLRQSLTNDYELQENELQWKENAYIVFVDNVKYIEEVNSQIKEIDSQIACGSSYVDFKTYYKTTRYIIYTALASLLVVLVTGCVLSYAYGIFYYQKNKEDIQYFRRNGLLSKEWNQIIKWDIVFQTVIVILLSIPIAYAINYFAQYYLFFTMIMNIFSLRFLLVVVVIIMIAILQISLSRLYYYRRGKMND